MAMGMSMGARRAWGMSCCRSADPPWSLSPTGSSSPRSDLVHLGGSGRAMEEPLANRTTQAGRSGIRLKKNMMTV